MVEEQHKNREGNKSNVILNTKIFVSPNSKINSCIKIGKDPKLEVYHDRLEQTQLPKNESVKVANSFEKRNAEYKSFLESQVQAKLHQRELERQNNKWFVDKELVDVSKNIAEEQVKQLQHKQKEKETKFFVESQILHKRNISQREKIGKYGSRGMNQDEYGNNKIKKLLLDINIKKKEMVDEINKQQALAHKTQLSSLIV